MGPRGGGGGHSLIWAIRGRAAGQGMGFWPRCLNRVYNLTCLCPKQGLNPDGSSLFLFLACEKLG